MSKSSWALSVTRLHSECSEFESLSPTVRWVDAAGAAEDQRLSAQAAWPQNPCCCPFPQTPLTALHSDRHPVHIPKQWLDLLHARFLCHSNQK